MSKISKTVPQKEAASSSRPAGEKLVVEPRQHELVPGGCVIDSDFKVEKPSSVAGRSFAWMPGAVPHLENWVRKLVSTTTYAERAWRDLSKGRWEARTHGIGFTYSSLFVGLGKDAVMRPPSGDEEVLSPISKPEKVIKRKRATDSEGQKPKKRVARKPKASMLHHEAFFQSRGELSRYEAKIRKLTEERDALKLLNKQREVEVKGLRAELEASRKEQAELAEQFRAEVDVVKSKAEEWKKNMDYLASEKKTARTQLASAQAQLQSLKEKALVQAKKIEEFQSHLSSTNSDRERLATELAEAKSEVEKTMANADAMVAVYRSDAEAAQVQEKEVVEAAQALANWVAEHAKCQSQRETLEELHARDFDLTVEIEKAKELEAEARVLAFPEDDDTGSASGSESEGASREKTLLP
ncbi:uncharacterized protein [Nicotiana tomentosiformis]|uniref:uncharacterized protein n=1 Tax=Nicotiana tomentosiformis TaxID=4098 RepID=UPI00388C87AF